MTIIKAFCVAFSTYSKIPMPHFVWEEKELRFHMIFFPWVGIVIGLMINAWYLCAEKLGLGSLTYTLIGTAIPLIITGGFHVDGYMDTMDALSSYKSKEEKLKILSDSHIGAFAVIMLALVGLIYCGAYSGIQETGIIIFSMGFALSRALSAIAVILFPKAKKEGMLHTSANAITDDIKKLVLSVLIVELLIISAAMLIIDVFIGIAVLIGTACLYIYYYYKMKKEFGGITGDAAGYFVVVCETVVALIVCLVTHL